MTQGIYKSTAGEQVMREWYERFKNRLNYPVEQKTVSTSLGSVNILITGKEDSESTPIVFLHGGLAGAPHALGELGDLPNQHRMYSIDIVGQSVASAQVRPDVKTDQYAKWVTEVLDALKLDSVLLMGVSWGGFVALNLASHFPKRVKGLILLNSASIVNGSMLKALFKTSIPLLWYNLFPSNKNRDWAYSAIFTEPHELWSPFIADSMKHTKMDFSAPPLVDPVLLKQLKAPVFIFAADQDLSFPGKALLKRAKTIFPNVLGTHLFENCRHCPPFNEAFTQKFEVQLNDVIGDIKALYKKETLSA